MKKTVAVRLEGGLGDHLLGMRVLFFVRKRYPEHEIIVYSDCAGNAAQLQAAALSPYVAEVLPIFQDRSRVSMTNLGDLTNIEEQYLTPMMAADVFIDASTKSLFIDASKTLDVSYYRIMAARPRLKVPPEATDRATEILGEASGPRYIAINFGKYGPKLWRSNLPNLRQLVMRLLEDPEIYLLNIFSRAFDFPHWPEAEREKRRRDSAEVSEVLAEICEWNSRILAIVDENIPTIAALLKRCFYFIGVDNGIKHLAWALDIPRTFFLPSALNDQYAIFRWVPDIHRMILMNNAVIPVTQILQAMEKALS